MFQCTSAKPCSIYMPKVWITSCLCGGGHHLNHKKDDDNYDHIKVEENSNATHKAALPYIATA